jgi:hypothetical protein
MSAWKEYKEKLGVTRPWDLLNPDAYNTDDHVGVERYAVCQECPDLISTTKQCKHCGCIMPMKVKLKEATCPVGKW